MNIIPLSCDIDDFCQTSEPEMNRHLLSDSSKRRHRKSTLALSEVMTVTVSFHQSGYRAFKHYYQCYVSVHLRWAFPRLVSYNRFIELMADSLLPLCVYLSTCKGQRRGISFIDSMPVAVCYNRRIHSYRVFNQTAKRGKNSVGWFYDFKVHLVVNDCGGLLALRITPGNTDDRTSVHPDGQAVVWQALWG